MAAFPRSGSKNAILGTNNTYFNKSTLLEA